MPSLKGTILICITFLMTVGGVLTYVSQQDRYSIYPHDKGLFVFDRKTATLNFCDNETCQMVKAMVPIQEPETTLITMPPQSAIVNGSVSLQSPVMAITPQGGVQPRAVAVPLQQRTRPPLSPDPAASEGQKLNYRPMNQASYDNHTPGNEGGTPSRSSSYGDFPHE